MWWRLVRILVVLTAAQYIGCYGNILELTDEQIQLTRKWWRKYRSLKSSPIAVSSEFARLIPNRSIVETYNEEELMKYAKEFKNGTILVDGNALIMAWISLLVHDLNNDSYMQDHIDEIKLRYNGAYDKEKFKHLNEALLRITKRDFGPQFNAEAQAAVNQTILAIIKHVVE